MVERVICNSIFNYFKSNRLFKPFQSGFLPGDSSIAQLLLTIHQIQTAFDDNPTVDVRGIFQTYGLAASTRKPKVIGSSPTVGYVQR